jgi:hypothetical protein
MITALIISHLLFFPSPITRDPSGAQEIALTQWGEAWIGLAHKGKAGSAFYDTIFKEDTKIQILINNEWVEYEVVESGVFRCETPRPNCNNATFKRMYEPGAVILATCWPRGEMTRGQWIIKMLPKTKDNKNEKLN